MSDDTKIGHGYHPPSGRDTGYDMYQRGDDVTACAPLRCDGFHPDIYDPEQYLPASRAEWQERVTTLYELMGDRTLAPCNDFLYMRRGDGAMRACVEGVINKAAIDAALPVEWLECGHADLDDVVYWDVEQPDRGDTRPFGSIFVDSVNLALPEALLYHGMNVDEGKSLLDILDCDRDFIREFVNIKHGAVLGCDRLSKVNRKLIGQGVNPLPLMADLLRHLVGKPHCGFWHPRVNEWAPA